MEILKAATEWARAEVFSARFFILFGLLFAIAALGFWQLGKTEIAKAYVFPALVAGILLLAVGLGIFFTNKSRVTGFEIAYHDDPSAFMESEIKRTEKSMREFSLVVFRIIPFIIAGAGLLIVFVETPIWRAISITVILCLM